MVELLKEAIMYYGEHPYAFFIDILRFKECNLSKKEYCMLNDVGKVTMIEVTRTESIQLSREYNDVLSECCHVSKNLWNEANYIAMWDCEPLRLPLKKAR